jgi:hypothetical protein
MMKSLFSGIVSLGFLILQTHAVAQQKDMCSSFRITAEIPANGIHAVGVIPVRVKMTNISDRDFWIDSWSRDWIHLQLVVSDARGREVPHSEDYQRQLDEAMRAVITANVSMPIAPGSSIEYPLFLDKLFNLEPGGDYSLAVSRGCGSQNQKLEAEKINFSSAASQSPPVSKRSSVSILLSTPEEDYPSGWAVPVNISIQNRGNQTAQWATPVVWGEVPDEFAMGVEIFDASGKALIAVPDTKALWKAHRYPEGGIGFIQVPAHGLAEENIALGNLYDLSEPGAYSAKIALVDTTTNLRIESNTIKFALRSADYFAGLKEKRMIPPFMMNISYVPHPQHDGHIDPSSAAMLMCNISDHEIWMYNASGNYAEILGPSNKAAPMTDAELKLWNQYNNPAISAVHTHQHPISNNWFQLAPHQAINFGVWTYEKSYDLSRPGRYRLRIYRYDEPDAEEGTKFIGLPIVYSNWINFEVPAK